MSSWCTGIFYIWEESLFRKKYLCKFIILGQAEIYISFTKIYKAGSISNFFFTNILMKIVSVSYSPYSSIFKICRIQQQIIEIIFFKIFETNFCSEIRFEISIAIDDDLKTENRQKSWNQFWYWFFKHAKKWFCFDKNFDFLAKNVDFIWVKFLIFSQKMLIFIL